MSAAEILLRLAGAAFLIAIGIHLTMSKPKP